MTKQLTRKPRGTAVDQQQIIELQERLHETTGHTHAGTAGEGPQIGAVDHLNVGTGTGAASGEVVIGSAGTPGSVVISGRIDDTTNSVALQAHTPIDSTFVSNTKDQLGAYFLIYGVADDFNTGQIVVGSSGASNIRFTFTSPKPGAILGGEFAANVAGGETSGNFTGSLWGAFGHVECQGTGNGITITDAYGLRGDIGHSSGGSGYTITNAIAVYGVNPSAVNIGTITNAYSFFGDGRLGIGGTPASPKMVINADGTGSFGDAGVAGQALRIGATVNVATSYGLMAAPALGASVTQINAVHSYPLVAARTPTAVYGFYAAQPYRSSGSVTSQFGMRIENMGASWVTNAYGLYINTQVDATTLNYAIYSAGGLNYFAGEVNMAGALNHDGATVGFYGTTPIAQAVLATGASHSVDDVITALQNLGLVKQA